MSDVSNTDDIAALISDPIINDALTKLASDKDLWADVTDVLLRDPQTASVILNELGEIDPLQIIRNETTRNVVLEIIAREEGPSSGSFETDDLDYSNVEIDRTFLARPAHDPPRHRRTRLNGFDVGDAIIRTSIANTEIRASLEGTSSSSSSLPASADGRRIYVGSIDYRYTEEDMANLFRPHGSVTRVDMPRDTRTGISKGYCFIEMGTQDECRKALAAMEGFSLDGRPLKIRPPKGTSNEFLATLPNKDYNAETRDEINPACRVFVRSLPPDITEGILYEIFGSCGAIRNIVLVPNHATGGHKGYAFVVFQDPSAAQLAITTLNGFLIGNRQLAVSQAKSSNDNQAPPTQAGGPGQNQGPGFLHGQGQLGIFDQPPAPFAQPPPHGLGNMQHAVPGGMAPPPPFVVGGAGASTCVLDMSNMFSYEDIVSLPPAQLKDEVGSECISFGGVVNIEIHYPIALQDLNGNECPSIHVYVVFQNEVGAKAAFATMDGRAFAGRVIIARLLSSIPHPSSDVMVV